MILLAMIDHRCLCPYIPYISYMVFYACLHIIFHLIETPPKSLLKVST